MPAFFADAVVRRAAEAAPRSDFHQRRALLSPVLPHRIRYTMTPDRYAVLNVFGNELGDLDVQWMMSSERRRKLVLANGGFLFAGPIEVAEAAGTAPWSTPRALADYMLRIGCLL